jgi:hypothetical protein
MLYCDKNAMVADLVHFARCVVNNYNITYIVIAFSSCRLVAREECQTARAHCRLVVLSLTKHTKWHVVVCRVVAM